MKDAIFAGIWGNSNYDSQKEGEEAPRRKILEAIEGQFQDAIEQIITGKPKSSSEDIDWDDPFFAASSAPRIGKPPGAGKPETEEEATKRAMLDELDQT